MVAQRHFKKIAIAAFVLGCVGSANAWITLSVGFNTGTTLTPFAGGSSLFTQPYTTTITSTSGDFATGTADFTGATESLDVLFTEKSQSVTGGTVSQSGSWTITSQSGFVPAVSPTGTYTANFDNVFGSGTYDFSFAGTVTPEPTSYAVVGVGVIGLLVRRKRSR